MTKYFGKHVITAIAIINLILNDFIKNSKWQQWTSYCCMRTVFWTFTFFFISVKLCCQKSCNVSLVEIIKCHLICKSTAALKWTLRVAFNQENTRGKKQNKQKKETAENSINTAIVWALIWEQNRTGFLRQYPTGCQEYSCSESHESNLSLCTLCSSLNLPVPTVLTCTHTHKIKKQLSVLL